MEGERILKALLNGETDDLFEDTKVGLRQFHNEFSLKAILWIMTTF